MSAPAFRFPNVSCSQCARDFGPGDSGFSDCREHQGRPADLDRKADEAIQRGPQIAQAMGASLPGKLTTPIGDGGPAFPLSMPEAAKLAATLEDLANPRLDSAERVYYEALAKALSGMTLRDYFAANAMQRMLAVPDDQRYGDRADKTLTVEQWQQWCVTGVVEHAYRVADAMLRARAAS